MKNIREKLLIQNLHNQGWYGQDTTVAIIDTGLSPHLDFFLSRCRVVDFFDATDIVNNNFLHATKENDWLRQNKQYAITHCYDNNGHGTAVAGILGGSGFLSGGINQGIAPKANIIAIKAINDNGEGDGKNILLAMQYILSIAKQYNIKVVCMSFGSNPVDNDPFIIGAELLWHSGIVVVASSGNDGPNYKTVKSPAASPNIICVGGIDDEFLVADFSGRGPYGAYTRPDIVAPSVGILTTNNIGGYTKMTGTSMAAPIIAGIVTCVLSANKNYTPDRVKELLITTATTLGDDKNISGWGLVNVQRIIDKVLIKPIIK